MMSGRPTSGEGANGRDREGVEAIDLQGFERSGSSGCAVGEDVDV